MIKAIIFDYGNVIKKPHDCLQDILDVYGVSKKTLFEAMIKPLASFRKGAIEEKEFWEKISQRLDKPLPANWRTLWRKQYEKGFYLYPEILDFIRRLKKKGIKVAILSNIIKPHLEIIKKNDGYKDFDVVILSCEVGLAKPHKEIFELALKRLNLEAEECVFIDNKEENLEFPQKMGFKVIHFQNNEQLIDDFKKLGIEL